MKARETKFTLVKKQLSKVKIDLIIFDLDGTLVDSIKDIVLAVNYTLGKMGKKEKSEGQVISYIGTGVKDLLKQALEDESESLRAKALEIFTSFYRERANDHSRLYPHVRETLEHFRAKRMAIATNRNRQFALSTLRAVKIDEFFTEVFGGDDVGCLKPSACSVNLAVDSSKKDKDKSLMVGDMVLDISAGKKAGVKTCAVTYGLGKAEELREAKPDFLIDDLGELKMIVE